MRRIPERNPSKLQDPLFAAWRYHALFTNNPAELIEAEATHRGHAIIEQVIADLKNSALAHLPCAKFAANAAWLACAGIAFNLTRALGTLAGDQFSRATTATIRARRGDAGGQQLAALGVSGGLAKGLGPGSPAAAAAPGTTSGPRS